MNIALEDVRQCFHYDSEDGRLYWKWHPKQNMRTKFLGREFGAKNNKSGYIDGHFLGTHINEHRLIFLYHYGYLPKEIDHIDRDGFNNKIENLRDVTRSQNNLNHNVRKTNKTGIKGVYWHKQTRKWSGSLTINKKKIYLGLFKTLDEAKEAREIAERLYT